MPTRSRTRMRPRRPRRRSRPLDEEGGDPRGPGGVISVARRRASARPGRACASRAAEQNLSGRRRQHDRGSQSRRIAPSVASGASHPLPAPMMQSQMSTLPLTATRAVHATCERTDNPGSEDIPHLIVVVSESLGLVGKMPSAPTSIAHRCLVRKKRHQEGGRHLPRYVTHSAPPVLVDVDVPELRGQCPHVLRMRPSGSCQSPVSQECQTVSTAHEHGRSELLTAAATQDVADPRHDLYVRIRHAACVP